jgi:hypothetical protein
MPSSSLLNLSLVLAYTILCLTFDISGDLINMTKQQAQDFKYKISQMYQEVLNFVFIADKSFKFFR